MSPEEKSNPPKLKFRAEFWLSLSSKSQRYLYDSSLSLTEVWISFSLSKLDKGFYKRKREPQSKIIFKPQDISQEETVDLRLPG